MTVDLFTIWTSNIDTLCIPLYDIDLREINYSIHVKESFILMVSEQDIATG